jgi:alkylation response protein AidB-like acyl-CoA dehydrogenase
MTPATTQAVLPLVPSDEERQIREAVRGICDGFPEDYARQKYEADEPPTELWDALAEKGYLGVNLPEEWGGGGLGMSGLATVGEEIAAAGKSLLLIVVSPAIVGNILARHGTDEQKERWLRGIAAGTTKIAFAITEPDAGTNSHNLSTSVERRGDRLLMRGQKTYISGVEHADAVLVVARSRSPMARSGCRRSRSWTWTRQGSPETRSRCRTSAPTSSGRSSSTTSSSRTSD